MIRQLSGMVSSLVVGAAVHCRLCVFQIRMDPISMAPVSRGRFNGLGARKCPFVGRKSKMQAVPRVDGRRLHARWSDETQGLGYLMVDGNWCLWDA